jgi:cytochrome oxidase Cu insertion factor (SCO1/SenC/PrrC family)
VLRISSLGISMLTGLLMCGLLAMATMAHALDTFRALPPDQQRSAPAFILPDYEGTPLAFAALHGKVVVVRFWATW